ncbi:hypothetical protein D3C76_1877190 [compost metagenome]
MGSNVDTGAARGVAGRDEVGDNRGAAAKWGCVMGEASGVVGAGGTSDGIGACGWDERRFEDGVE